MPISTPQIHALNSLKSLKTNPYEPEVDTSQNDPSVQRLHIAQQQADEFKNRMFANQRAQAASAGTADPERNAAMYGGEVTALKNMLASKQADIEANPLTAQRGQVEDYLGQEREAVQQGFGGGAMGRGTDQVQYQNPIQARAGYGRAQAEKKLNMPLEQERIKAQGGIAQQQEQSRGALDVAKTNQSGLSARYGAMQDLLSGGQPIRSLNPTSGAVSFGPEDKGVSNPILNQITTARRNYENAKNNEGTFSGGEATKTTKAALDQAIANGISQYPSRDPAHSRFIQAILGDDQASKLTLDQILQMKGETDVTPEERAELQDMLNLFRGF